MWLGILYPFHPNFCSGHSQKSEILHAGPNMSQVTVEKPVSAWWVCLGSPRPPLRIPGKFLFSLQHTANNVTHVNNTLCRLTNQKYSQFLFKSFLSITKILLSAISFCTRFNSPNLHLDSARKVVFHET